MIKFTCEHCGKDNITAPDVAAGKKGKCPACKQVVQIPALDDVETDLDVVEEPEEAAPPPKKPAPTRPVAQPRPRPAAPRGSAQAAPRPPAAEAGGGGGRRHRIGRRRGGGRRGARQEGTAAPRQ